MATNNRDFLPISKADLEARGIDQLDFIMVTGDAYVDHPSFGAAVIGRVLEAEGYLVGIIAQPNYQDVEAFKVLGEPRLGFLVNAGNIDSMVAHYTAAKKPRREDFYSPGGRAGLRPDRAVLVYCSRIKSAYRDVPVIIGGLESSLRRYAHYDYWQDKVRRSILLDAKADLLVYGMGEVQIVEIAKYLSYGSDVKKITGVRGTCYVTSSIDQLKSSVMVPSFEEVASDRKAYGEAFKRQYLEMDDIWGQTVVQPHGNRYLVQNPPARTLTEKEMDRIYDLPYARNYHPSYEEKGGVPAITEVKFSLISQRGCFGSCNFCALTFHQGRVIQSRSHDSIVREAEILTRLPDFKGYINDVGGPTANFRNRACMKQVKQGTCKGKECLFPAPCKQLEIDHTDYLALLRKLRNLDGVKKVFVRSGIRYDYLIHDKNTTFFEELAKHHVSGQLKVAPEHISPKVLKQMGKPGKEVYDRFINKFKSINNKLGMKQYVVPYLMSSHPGSDLAAAIDLAQYIKKWGYTPQQVQDFYPTPGSLSTTIYYTGVDPLTGEKVYVPKAQKEKSMQRALLQCGDPKNYDVVKKALIEAGREDLIGHGPECLIRPRDGRPVQAQRSSRVPQQRSSDRRQSNRRDKSRNQRSGGNPNTSSSKKATNPRKRKKR